MTEVILSDSGQLALQNAVEEAQGFGHNYIGPEHLLLGLVRIETGILVRVLDRIGVRKDKIRSDGKYIMGRGVAANTVDPSLTPRSKSVLVHAQREAGKLGVFDQVDAEHLLLGILSEGESVGAGILEANGITLEQVRVATREVLFTYAEIGEVARRDSLALLIGDLMRLDPRLPTALRVDLRVAVAGLVSKYQDWLNKAVEAT